MILHEQCEDPYFEITNGPISLCCNAGEVGETEDEEDEIFKKVTDALNKSGADFHSENKLELKQHLEIQELKYKAGELQARCDKMEAALKEISGESGKLIPPKHDMISIAREALAHKHEGINEWKTMETAPKDGSTIEITYDKEGKETCLACWSEQRVCMAGPPMGCCGAGWATPSDSDVDTNLPLDPPLFWREYNEKEVEDG